MKGRFPKELELILRDVKARKELRHALIAGKDATIEVEGQMYRISTGHGETTVPPNGHSQLQINGLIRERMS